jgi:hypothetical protein
MATEYSFRNMVLGEVADVCNEMADDGFGPDEMYKEGKRMYILFSKWVAGEDEVTLSELDQVYVAMDKLADQVAEMGRALSLVVVTDPSE